MGRTIEGCERKGKKYHHQYSLIWPEMLTISFWLKLSGEGRLPVLHFGMTGMVQVDYHHSDLYSERADALATRPGTHLVQEKTEGDV
jgi:formamidopyrimidine-DNA glycosylase